ncbi:MAG: acetoacetate--CoA ligase, partial [Candidatus Eremiobacteraeota bacterium]|nr:acetoacetate--CoA ligase [Candidatus Eremiobacteraeota bacterium]
MTEGQLLWTPDPATIAKSQIVAFMAWLERERDLRFDDYESLRQWSVSDLDGFWSAIWSFYDVHSTTPSERVVGERK